MPVLYILFALLALAYLSQRNAPQFTYRSYKQRNPFPAHLRLTFASVVTSTGTTINGEIEVMNVRAGEAIELRARPTHKGKPAKYQVGSAKLDNQLPPEFFKVIQNPANELSLTVIALEETGDEELPAVGVVALELDGDPTEGVRTIRIESAVNWVPFGADTVAFDIGTPRIATDEELFVEQQNEQPGGAATGSETGGTSGATTGSETGGQSNTPTGGEGGTSAQ